MMKCVGVGRAAARGLDLRGFGFAWRGAGGALMMFIRHLYERTLNGGGRPGARRSTRRLLGFELGEDVRQLIRRYLRKYIIGFSHSSPAFFRQPQS